MPRKTDKAYGFNLVDFFIIIALAVVICAIAFTVLGNDIRELTSDKAEVSYTLHVDSSYESSFVVGDQITTGHGKNAGTVISVIGLYKDTDKAMVVVSAEAYKVRGELFIKGQHLMENEEFSVMLPDGSVLEAHCASVITINR